MIDADWIKVGLAILGPLAAGIGIYVGIRTQLAVMTTKNDIHATITASAIAKLEMSTAAAITELRAELKPVADLGTKVALLDQRLAMTEQRVIELQHGEGRVLPLVKGHYER